MAGYDLIITGAQVIDPANGIERRASVAVKSGRIVAVGDALDATDAEQIDVGGAYLSPGWVDIHVHTYCHLAFADPDTVGVLHGVTTIVDAGGGGIWTYEAMRRYWDGRIRTDLYAYLMFHPAGIYMGRDAREYTAYLNDLNAAPDSEWDAVIDNNRDRVLAIKSAVFSAAGWPLVEIAKAVVKRHALPLYLHIGDQLGGERGENITAEVVDMLEPGDVLTHVYNNNYGSLIDERDDSIIATAFAAKRRGVWFDVGFGNLNFSFAVFDKLQAAGLIADAISSDLQGGNIAGPTHSLAHVMSIFLNHGLTLSEVIERVTVNPGRMYAQEDQWGTLSVGAPADITVFDINDGEYVFRDTSRNKRTGQSMIVPRFCVKAGEVIQCDFERGVAQENWSFMPADDFPAPRACGLDTQQRGFAHALAADFRDMDWEDRHGLNTTFYERVRNTGIDERHATEALYDLLLEHRFTVPPGWLLNGLAKADVLRRLADA